MGDATVIGINKDKRVEISGDNKDKRPEFTDRVLHAISNDTYKDQAKIEQMKQEIIKGGEDIKRSRLMGNGGEVEIRRIMMRQQALAGTINETRLERIIDNQVVMLHAMHSILYPNSPRILHETPMEAEAEIKPTTPSDNNNS